MQVAFRVDASTDIGTGHVMRCLALADALQVRGARCCFVCRPHIGHLLKLIAQRGHHAISLEPADESFTAQAGPLHSQWLGTDWASDALQTKQTLCEQEVDWLVVDHYALDRRWEQSLRPYTHRIMVIDDLADRQHDCDLLLDQNLGRQALDYVGLISHQTQTLIGPAYALLRPEFALWREHSLQRRVKPLLKNLLIAMGGVDQRNATGLVLDALTDCELPADLSIIVLMGPNAPWLAEVQVQAAAMPRPTRVLSGVSNIAQLMAESDLCIGAAGGSAWERCCLGLPTLILILAANQQAGAMALEAHGAAWLAADTDQLIKQLTAFFNPEKADAILIEMSQAASKLTAGDGAMQVFYRLLADHD